jgi:hypothetical protein
VIDLLQNIVDLMVCWVETGVMLVVNLCIVGVAAAAAGVFALLPDMPAQPPVPSDVQAALASADYYLPLSFTLELVATSAALIATIWLVRIPLRWIRAQ